jgi:hypothetical protein
MTTLDLDAPISLEGERLRDGLPGASVRLELTERVGPSRWRATATQGPPLVAGDRIHFGDQANHVCFIGTLDATVAHVEPNGRGLNLDFEFYGAALDEMIAALLED